MTRNRGRGKAARSRYGAPAPGLLDVAPRATREDATIDYDTSQFRALQNELKVLNEAAVASGLLPQPPDPLDALDEDDESAPRELSPDKGKARATRLLEMAGRIEGDESPGVPGTAFTEAGVVRLIAHLRKRQVRRFPFLRRLHRYLTLPVAIGLRTSAGIAVERLQIASRQLKEVEGQGWDRYSAIRDARRFGSTPPPPEPKPPAPAEPPRKGRPAKAGRPETAVKPRSSKSAKLAVKSKTTTRKAS